jgi:hypothetical protein
MSAHSPFPAFDGGLFNDNRNRFPVAELTKYAGQQVAWNLEGTEILAADADFEGLLSKLRAAGIPLSRVVLAVVEPMDGVAYL